METGRKGKLIRHHSASNLSNRASTLSKPNCSPDAIFAFIPSSFIIPRMYCMDFILKKELRQVIDWSRVDKKDYLLTMERSPVKDLEIKNRTDTQHRILYHCHKDRRKTPALSEVQLCLRQSSNLVPLRLTPSESASLGQ